MPDGLALDVATALLQDGRTATLLVRTAEPKPGERVLVEAAAGGVGSLLVQLVKAAGAHVVAAAGGPRKLAIARELGADEVVDYLEPDWPARAGQVDVALDGVGGDMSRTVLGLLPRGGRLLSYGLASGTWSPVTEEAAAERGVTLLRTAATAEDLRSCAESALAQAAAGRLRPVIGQRFPLDRAADAHAAIETRATVGKTLLEVG